MKALRYLLMMVVIMGVLSVNAQTPKYGQAYKPEKQVMHQSVQVQLPEATMSSTGSNIMYTGSTLPQAAVTGTTTTYSTGRPGHIRKGASGEDGGDTPPSDPHGPNEDPLGDVLWPLMCLALAYGVYLKCRKKKEIS